MIRVSGEAPCVLGLMMNPMDVIVEMQQHEKGGGAMWWPEFLSFPRGVMAHLDCYREIMVEAELPLSRSERHVLALETSKAMGCHLCAQHHEEALRDLSLDPCAPDKRALLAEFATTVTKTPQATQQFRDRFAAFGYSAAHFQHAVFIASYCNFTSRCALAMNTPMHNACQEALTHSDDDRSSSDDTHDRSSSDDTSQ